MENLHDIAELNNQEQLYFDEYIGVVNHSVQSINYTPTELPIYSPQPPHDITMVALDYILSDPVKIFIVLSSCYHVGFFATLGMFTFAAISENFKVADYLNTPPEYVPNMNLAQDIIEKTVTIGLAFNGVVSAHNLTPKIGSGLINVALLEAVYIPLMVTNAKEMLDATKELKTPFDAHHIVVPTVFGADPNGVNFNLVPDLLKSAMKTFLKGYIYKNLLSYHLSESASGYIATIASSITPEAAMLAAKNYFNDNLILTNISKPIILNAIKWGVFFPFLPDYTKKLHEFQAMELFMSATKLGIDYAMNQTNSNSSAS